MLWRIFSPPSSRMRSWEASRIQIAFDWKTLSIRPSRNESSVVAAMSAKTLVSLGSGIGDSSRREGTDYRLRTTRRGTVRHEGPSWAWARVGSPSGWGGPEKWSAPTSPARALPGFSSRPAAPVGLLGGSRYVGGVAGPVGTW